ncbi:MAG: hypothetical protein IJN85_04180 [Oscillospiraceae bacterium]|nr:hypothetical protein [Oscillospiraceae bacterium]
MNPMALLHLKSKLEKFRENHPKVPLFFQAASGEVRLDSIIELKITNPEGKSIVTNIKVTQDDIDLISDLQSQLGKQ